MRSSRRSSRDHEQGTEDASKDDLVGGAALLASAATALPAYAGDPSGNFMVRVLGTVVDPATEVKSLTANDSAFAGNADEALKLFRR